MWFTALSDENPKRKVQQYHASHIRVMFLGRHIGELYNAQCHTSSFPPQI